MKLLLIVCLSCALLYTAESLSCHECASSTCTNSTSVQCPITSPICKTITSVRITGTSLSVTVEKNCSSLMSCITPTNVETEWSVNRGFSREAHTQLCCITDDCNFPTLAIPNVLTNGKECPSCASSDDAIAGTCNATLACAGVEDRCFNGTTMLNSTEVQQLGCISNNLCEFLPILQALMGADAQVTCAAPWSISLSGLLLTFALTAQRVFV